MLYGQLFVDALENAILLPNNELMKTTIPIAIYLPLNLCTGEAAFVILSSKTNVISCY